MTHAPLFKYCHASTLPLFKELALAAMVGALLAVMALVGTAQGRLLTQTDRVMCNSKPPNGTWVMEHFTPLSPLSPNLTRHARSVLFMNEVEDNFYIGTQLSLENCILKGGMSNRGR